jgi:hypothetical protein
MSRKRNPQVGSRAVLERREDHTLTDIEWFCAHPQAGMNMRAQRLRADRVHFFRDELEFA